GSAATPRKAHHPNGAGEHTRHWPAYGAEAVAAFREHRATALCQRRTDCEGRSKAAGGTRFRARSGNGRLPIARAVTTIASVTSLCYFRIGKGVRHVRQCWIKN